MKLKKNHRKHESDVGIFICLNILPYVAISYCFINIGRGCGDAGLLDNMTQVLLWIILVWILFSSVLDLVRKRKVESNFKFVSYIIGGYSLLTMTALISPGNDLLGLILSFLVFCSVVVSFVLMFREIRLKNLDKEILFRDKNFYLLCIVVCSLIILTRFY